MIQCGRKAVYQRSGDVETLWRMSKNSIASAHIRVPQKCTQLHLNELTSARTIAT
jgi:hypothetical protein